MFGIAKRIIDLVHRWYDPIGHARRLGVTIGKECRLLGVDFSTEPYLITIGDHVSATRTQFLTHDGSVWVFRETQPEIDVVRPIRVGNNVFLGFGVVVLPGVSIGDNVVVGAGSVVTKDIPSNCVVAGVPAKYIRSIDDFRNSIIERSEKTKNMSIKEKKSYYIKKYIAAK
ncbi:acyltransferase [Xanthobacter autotrophicus]|uniref:acyltransferase n=1 Tax=Xanthobacter autotrophicus TaxID=280 RepID=UPI001E486196|nr:acyltransferase [Xanthobacter autotrophicus]UDQ88170.1 acyltransferase [Xanthobacter autotrophicus]